MGKFFMGLFFVLVCLMLAFTVWVGPGKESKDFSDQVDTNITEIKNFNLKTPTFTP